MRGIWLLGQWKHKKASALVYPKDEYLELEIEFQIAAYWALGKRNLVGSPS